MPLGLPLPAYRGGSTLVDQTRAQDFNLAVLQRIDTQIQEILYSATHVAVYEFDTKGKYWKRSNIEGTLFLVKRQVQPRCQIIVMNGKGMENFYEVVDGSLETEMLDTFLLYTKGNNQLYGIWFYEDKNCDEFAEYLNKIIRGMPKPSRSFQSTERGEAPAGQAGANGAGGDDDAFWDAKKVQSHPGQPKQQQLANDSGGSSCPPVGSVNGESDLMRLFRQAKERGPAVAESATPPPQPQAQAPPPAQSFTQQPVVIQVPPQVSNPSPPGAQPAAATAQPTAAAVAQPTAAAAAAATPPQQQPPVAQTQQGPPPVQPVPHAPVAQPTPQPAQVIVPQQAVPQQAAPTLMLDRPQALHPMVTTLTLPTTPSPVVRPPMGLNPTGAPENAGVQAMSPPPPTSVPGPYPLPPEFFKSSKENGVPVAQQQQGASSQNMVRVMSPDPNLLPLPSMPSLLSDAPHLMNPATISTPLGAVPAMATPQLSHQFDSLSGDSRDANGLARFFPTAGGADGASQTINNVGMPSLIANTTATASNAVMAAPGEHGRHKFRQAIAILMQDDEFVDRFIAGFKRAGLDIS